VPARPAAEHGSRRRQRTGAVLTVIIGDAAREQANDSGEHHCREGDVEDQDDGHFVSVVVVL